MAEEKDDVGNEEEAQENFLEELREQAEREEMEREIEEKSREHTIRQAENVKRSKNEATKTNKPVEQVKEEVKEQVKEEVKKKIKKEAKKAIKKAAKKVTKKAALAALRVAGPYILIGLAAVLFVVFIVVIFTNDKNEEAPGLGGSSQSIPVSNNSSEHRDLVDNLLAKAQGNNPSLVIHGLSANDLNWVETIINEETGETVTTHPLDLRVLKAIEYLTNLHEYIEIGMLRTDSPGFVKDTVVIDSEANGGEDTQIVLDTFSSFSTGQAFSIVAIDRTEIPQLISAGEAPPIAVSWQKTLIERAVRPLWEEITFNIGVLDRNSPIYQDVFEDTHESYGAAFDIEKKLYDARVSDSVNLYKNSFRTLKRTIALLDRALGLDDYLEIDLTNSYALDNRTISYFESAKDQLNPIVDYLENNILKGIDLDSIESNPESDEGVIIDSNDMVEAIKYLGEGDILERIHNGARFIYKATQVANMVNWDKASNLDLKKAYEARNKIRQVIKELLEMPREVSVSSNTSFDVTMVAKQIITFSPEDDLDNGAERMDVYPYGIKYVDVGGIAMEVLTEDGKADGVLNYSDIHFSHAPVSANGVFSKGGANYVNKISPDSNPLEDALSFMDETDIEGQSDALHNLLVGECVSAPGYECQKSSYKDYIYVGF